MIHPINISKETKGSWIANLGFSDTWLEATCHLCNLFSSVRPGSRSSGRYVLRVFHSLALFPNIPPSQARINLSNQSRPFFAVVPSGSKTLSNDLGRTGYITIIPSKSILRTELYGCLVPERIPYLQLRDWISYCENKHGNCKLNTWRRPLSFKVIDCKKQKIIELPPGCSYVALSYVWGPQKPNETNALSASSLSNPEAELHSNISNVIRDAIAVTLGLNERYLWADKYCIDHNNSQAEREQIKNMDLTYEGAKVTIFAAYGHSANCGLPGVTFVPRKPQTSALIEGMLFASTLRDPLYLVNNSTWSTRGWTYQEVVLSRRRLFFTEEQVYFMCNGMDCFESIHKPLSKFHRKCGNRFAGRGMPFQPYDNRPRRRFFDFMNHIENFTGRDLTRDSDSLNAFAGILRTFEKASPPINNFCGLPIVPGTALQSFTHSLTWIHDRSKNPKSIKRRLEFPSFSFAGWEGKASLQTRVDGRKSGVEDFKVADIDIQITTEDGSLFQLEDIQELNRSQIILKSSSQLQIYARVLGYNTWEKTNLSGDYCCVTGANPVGFEVMMRYHWRVPKMSCRSIRNDCGERVSAKNTYRGVRMLVLGLRTPDFPTFHYDCRKPT